jgi:sigma-E factor negative regulatory protein RseA
MSDKLQNQAELISALVDGQLRGEEFGCAVDHLTATEEARDAWDTYHRMGEVMRSGHMQLRAHDPAFVQRLRQKITDDATELVATNALLTRAEWQKFSVPVSAANDPWWRRVAGLASVALVGVLAWQGYQFVGERGQSVAAPQLAQLPAQAPASAVLAEGSGAAEVMLRDPRLDAMLAAHRQFGGTSALQMPSGFLRNATFEEGNR